MGLFSNIFRGDVLKKGKYPKNETTNRVITNVESLKASLSADISHVKSKQGVKAFFSYTDISEPFYINGSVQKQLEHLLAFALSLNVASVKLYVNDFPFELSLTNIHNFVKDNVFDNPLLTVSNSKTENYITALTGLKYLPSDKGVVYTFYFTCSDCSVSVDQFQTYVKAMSLFPQYQQFIGVGSTFFRILENVDVSNLSTPNFSYVSVSNLDDYHIGYLTSRVDAWLNHDRVKAIANI